jgi:adenosyl cobinamide kinase/adenosyl cobinamide phosphate guanylyltransferase
MGLALDLPVSVVATAEQTDEEMTGRISSHKAERPSSWRTIEEPLLLGDAVRSAGDDFVIVDCLTVWLGNLLHCGRSVDEIYDATSELVESLLSRSAMSVVVSNEVGLGIHPASELGRTYRDLLGWLNATLVASSSESLFLVAGRMLRLDTQESMVRGSRGS